MDDLRRAAKNTDRELWREREGDYYADSIFVTEKGSIGMNVGGFVFVKPIKAWHELAARQWSDSYGKEPKPPILNEQKAP